jgi:hypothetical protein
LCQILLIYFWYPKLIHDDYSLLPWNMLFIAFVCYWMFWCIAGTIEMCFGSKIADLVPQTRRNSLLAKILLIAKFFSRSHAPGALLAQPSVLASMLFGCWLILGSVVHSEVFLSSIYNFITLKQHLGNAHNIKRFSN